MITTDKEILDFIAEKVDSLRVENNLSIYELSLKANVSNNTLNDLFKKRSIPSIRTLNRLCNALDVPLWQFFIFGNEEYPLLNSEKKLISKFRGINDNSKKVIFELLDNMK